MKIMIFKIEGVTAIQQANLVECVAKWGNQLQDLLKEIFGERELCFYLPYGEGKEVKSKELIVIYSSKGSGHDSYSVQLVVCERFRFKVDLDKNTKWESPGHGIDFCRHKKQFDGSNGNPNLWTYTFEYCFPRCVILAIIEALERFPDRDPQVL